MALKEFLTKEEERVRSMPDQLASLVRLNLVETDTFWLYKVDATLISQHSEEAQSHRFVESSERRDMPVASNDSWSQTINPSSCDQTMQTCEIITKDIGSMATTWDLHVNSEPVGENANQALIMEATEMKGLILLKDLNLLECLISLHLYQPKLKAYRRPLTIENDDDIVAVNLWSLTVPTTEDTSKDVTCMTWNPAIRDFFCTGYGTFYWNPCQSTGTVCCWSLKNLMHPMRLFQCPASVSAVSFSKAKPNLLACALFDGTVRIYDIIPRKGELLLDSRKHGLHHTAPIWCLLFTKISADGDDTERPEVLVTASEDGHVSTWNYTNTPLTKIDILTLKLAPMGVDFFATGVAFCGPLVDNDPIWALELANGHTLNTFLLGTGRGSIHLCAMTTSANIVKTFEGHDGPVYKLCFSPIFPNIFLSSGADWTVKLWRLDSYSCLLTLQQDKCPVLDVIWSANSSTVFACISANNLEIWDLGKSILDPIISQKSMRKESYTTVLFAPNSSSIFVGSSTGKINVYQIKNLFSSGAIDQSELMTVIANLPKERTYNIQSLISESTKQGF